MRLAFSGALTATTADKVIKSVPTHLACSGEDGGGEDEEVVVDLSAVTSIDSTGAAVLAALRRRVTRQGGRLRIVGTRPDVAATLRLLPFVDQELAVQPRRPGILEALGDQGAALWEFLSALVLLGADVAWFAVVGLFRPRTVRWGRVAYEMASMGSRALGVVGLIALLVGATMALQAAAQLRQFGANIFVVDLVAISITRELGPLMTAVVVAGRSGSAVAAELGTMVINEEVDALKTMGIQPVRFLVVPKVLAILVVQPLLTVLADALAIAGGWAVAVAYLDVGATAYLTRLSQALLVKDLLTGLLKSGVFAVLIVTIGALFGLRTRGGAEAVGRNTTASVVAAIFAVIVADALASLLFYFGG